MPTSTRLSRSKQEQHYRFAGLAHQGRLGGELWGTRRKSLRGVVARLQRVATAARQNLTPPADGERPTTSPTGTVTPVRGSVLSGPGVTGIADRLAKVEKTVAGAYLP
jgi:hypothetical protein